MSFCDSKDYSLSDSSVHGILQGRILRWIAISFSRGSSWPTDWTLVSCIAGGHPHCREILYWLSLKACVFKGPLISVSTEEIKTVSHIAVSCESGYSPLTDEYFLFNNLNFIFKTEDNVPMESWHFEGITCMFKNLLGDTWGIRNAQTTWHFGKPVWPNSICSTEGSF